MKQENKKLIQNLKTKNQNLNKKLNTNWKYVKKKKLPEQSDFTIGENYNLNLFKMKDVFFFFYVFIYFFY